MGGTRFHGGLSMELGFALNPLKYALGLGAAVKAEGARIYENSPVEAIGREGGDFVLRTPRGRLLAKKLIVATNGYSGDAFPWLKRRVMPFDAYQTVSEPMPAERLRQLLPGDRTYIDWNFNVDWMRRAPDEM